MKFFDRIVEKLYFAQDGNLALYDKLTGVYNYNWYSIISTKKYFSKEVFITVIDVNNFKRINDTKGHLYGNKVLQNVAVHLKKLKDIDDSVEVVRYGGDEFILISNTNLTSLINLYNDNDRIISFGVTKKEKDEHLSVAFNRADNKMYKYKQKIKKHNKRA